MKIGVIADTHGNVEAAKSALFLLKEHGAEIFVHIGDGIADTIDIEAENGLHIEKIPGNNDLFFDLPEERLFDWNGVKAFALHGHRQGINRYLGQVEYLEILSDLAWKAREHGAEMLLFGHTHAPEDLTINGVRLLNPGALDFGTIEKTCLLIDTVNMPQMTLFLKIDKGVAKSS